jgi:hypothetical protein
VGAQQCASLLRCGYLTPERAVTPGSNGLMDRDYQAPQDGTVRTMFHIIWSRAVLICSEGSVRGLHRPAQQKRVGVRTMMVVLPGRLPLFHQFPALLLRTIQPRALRASPAG